MWLSRALSCLFRVHMGDCDYFQYNGMNFCITGCVSHFLFFPLGVREALMRVPVEQFGSFGGIDVSHVPGSIYRCKMWAMRRALATWAAVILLMLSLLILFGGFGYMIVGFALLAPSAASGCLALSLYIKKPDASEYAISAYKELLKPLFPESDIPSLEPTALEAVTAILSGRELQNELGKAMEEHKVNVADIIDSSVLVHPNIARGNHGSNQLHTPDEHDIEIGGPAVRPVLEGKIQPPDVPQDPHSSTDFTQATPSAGSRSPMHVSPLAKMLESIPEPCEIEIQNEENSDQFCVLADGTDSQWSSSQWKDVASTVNKFLGPKATILGRGVLPPETCTTSERGRNSLFLEDTPVHDDNHVIYIEAPLALSKSRAGHKKWADAMRILERFTTKGKIPA